MSDGVVVSIPLMIQWLSTVAKPGEYVVVGQDEMVLCDDCGLPYRKGRDEARHEHGQTP